MVSSIRLVTGVHLNFMCGNRKTKHSDEPYIKPVIKFFFQKRNSSLEPFVVLLRRKIVRLLPNVSRQKMSPPIIKPVKKTFFINSIIRGDLFGYQRAT